MAGPLFFPTAADFRRWLQANHETAAELLVGFWKKDSGKPSMDWPQARDQALCFGWIEGARSPATTSAANDDGRRYFRSGIVHR